VVAVSKLPIDWGTIVQNVKKEIHRGSVAIDEDRIKVALVNSMIYFRPERFWFNEGIFHFWLLTGQQQYVQVTGNAGDAVPSTPSASTDDLPEDVVSPIGISVRQEDGDRWLPLDEDHINRIRWLTYTDNHQSTPRIYAWYDESLFVSPIPNDNYLVRMDYVYDVGIPDYHYDSTGFYRFFKPFSSVVMTDTTELVWITNAEELIRQRAKWDIYYNYLDDLENAQKMERGVEIARQNLRKRSLGFRRHVQRRPTFVSTELL
jgi:hypothetical protein